MNHGPRSFEKNYNCSYQIQGGWQEYAIFIYLCIYLFIYLFNLHPKTCVHCLKERERETLIRCFLVPALTRD